MYSVIRDIYKLALRNLAIVWEDPLELLISSDLNLRILELVEK